MSTFTSSKDSSQHYWLRFVATEGDLDPVTNKSTVSWAFYIHGAAGWWFAGYDADASVKLDGSTVWSINDVKNPPASASSWSGSSYLLASGSREIEHDPDGSLDMAIVATYRTVTLSSPRPTSVMTINKSMPLTTLRQEPDAPTDLTATWVSDTQVDLAWANHYPTNGEPDQNNIQASINGGAFGALVSPAPTESASVATAANRKTAFRVNAENETGASDWSNTATVYTTPAAPTDVAAEKNSSGDIVVTWTPHVAFAEHEHVVRHGTKSGSTITWDGSPLGTVSAGTSTITHDDPSPSAQHVYAVYARNTDAAARQSTQVQSNTVVLLTAPNKPSLPPIAQYADKAEAFAFPWAHNPVDTTGQTAYEVGYSTNGGSSWSTTGKVTSGTQSKTFAASSYSANQALTLRVRTWGQATSGGSDGTGASPWSDTVTVTFKTRPTVTITAPTSSADYEQAALTVQLGFSQSEGATFVNATIELYDGATLLEQRVSTTLAATLLATPVENGASYTLKVTVRDSNGLVSDLESVTFDVAYTAPVAATVTAVFLRESGIGQLGITIPEPGEDEAEAVAVTITRTIDGVTETVVEEYPAESSLTILDRYPSTYGDNLYRVTTVSGDGATVSVEKELSVAEDEWAYMTRDAGDPSIIRFGGELKPQASPSVESALFKAAGRSRPIGQYGTTGDLVVSGTGDLVTGYGSSAEEVEAFLLVPGRGCYRDPSGRRMFGRITGKVSRDSHNLGSFAYTVTETS